REDEDRAREWMVPQLLAHQRSQTVGAATEVHRLRRHQHPYAGRNRNHVAAFTARSTVINVAASIPSETRTVAAPIAISIIAAPPGHPQAIASPPPAPPASPITPLNSHPPRPNPRPLPPPLAVPPLPPRSPPPQQLLRRQGVPTRNGGHCLAALIALGDDSILLLQAPGAPPAGSGKHLQPAHRFRLGFG